MSARRYLFLTSMSRSGTSLLYQLLFGHPDLYLAPFRVQFVCAAPFAFPLRVTPESHAAFAATLASKTTIPMIESELTAWHNLTTRPLIDLVDAQTLHQLEELAAQSRDVPWSPTSLDVARDMVERMLALEPAPTKYYCLHDDHSYVAGATLFRQAAPGCKIVTTVRHPLDMLASKKNRLVYHMHGQRDPGGYRLTERVLERELTRALFSLAIASREYANDTAYYPVVFEHIKGKDRAVSMKRLARYLDIDFHECMLSDERPVAEGVLLNELMYAGSSLQFLTKGAKTTTVGARNVSLTPDELAYLRGRFDFDRFDQWWDSEAGSFYDGFPSIFELCPASALPTLAKWVELYARGENEHVFGLYSSFNYGKGNAAEAFEVAQ
jgi:hypothetical protein